MKSNIENHSKKLQSDWIQLGQGKSTESIKKNMKGRWTIKWGNSIKEYEEIEKGDNFNVSSKSKGDLDYLKENHMNYKNHFIYLFKLNEDLNSPAKVNYTDNSHYADSDSNNDDIPSIDSPINIDSIIDLNVPEIE